MKKLGAILLCLILLLLCACANAHVSYKLTEDNVINVDYTATIDRANTDIDGFVQTISAYWENKGFEVASDTTDELTTLTGEKTIAHDSRAQATNTFSELVTASDSLFDEAKFSYVPSFETDEFTLEANVSLEDVIRQNKAQNIPEEEIDALQASAKNGTYSISVALPGNVVSTNAHRQDGSVCIWDLPYGQTTDILIVTQKSNDENIATYQRLENDFHTDSVLFTACCALAGLIVLAIIIVVVVKKVQKYRSSKVRVKKFR